MTARTRCRGCQRLTHVAEMLWIQIAHVGHSGDAYMVWRCARCVEDARPAKKEAS